MNGRAYYNEIDPFAAQWLRNLIEAGHIAPGDVDDRSIVDVRPGDLAGYSQCHFFAGIGGWSYALRLSGWPDDQPVWTGSCPCQPFSTSGKKRGVTDSRHLWPVFQRLIYDGAPSIVFGEQVARKAGIDWLSSVRADLEEFSYAVGAANLCSAGVGKWHRRQRLYWVAYADHEVRWPLDARLANRQGTREAAALARALREGDWSPWNGGPPASATTFAWLREWESKHGLRCLDDGIPGDLAFHRAFGNAIDPQVAAQFILASVEAINEIDGAAMTAPDHTTMEERA